jgi:hypothetical protein
MNCLLKYSSGFRFAKAFHGVVIRIKGNDEESADNSNCRNGLGRFAALVIPERRSRGHVGRSTLAGRDGHAQNRRLRIADVNSRPHIGEFHC